MTAPELGVIEEDYGERATLNARPQVPIDYPVRISDAANRVWFQDRASRTRFPAEISANAAEAAPRRSSKKVEELEEVTGFRVRPLQPPPVGRRYDLGLVRGMVPRCLWRTPASLSPGLSPWNHTSDDHRLRSRRTIILLARLTLR